MSHTLALLAALGLVWRLFQLIPSDPPRPCKVPEHVIAGRRAQLMRNRGRWGL